MADNFGFVKKYDQDLYDKIHEAESYLKIDYANAGDKLRVFLESFINKIIDKYDLEDALEKYCLRESEQKNKRFDIDDLYSRICFLTSFNDIKALKNPRIKALVCDHKKDGRLVRYIVSATYTDFSGKKVNRKIQEDDKPINAFTFIRWAGNAFHHDPEKIKNIKVKRTYQNALEAFRVMYHILACYYGDSQKFGEYKESNIPLLNYNIEKAFVPRDSERTGCVMEYETKKLNGSGRWEWQIIREYKISEIDKNFFLRGYTTSDFTRYQLEDISSAMVEVENITNFESKKSPYYIIGYNFRRKPQKLADIITGVDLKNRYEMCLRIARCFEQLHTLKYPICHRMLNHNCIYAQDCSDVDQNWVVSVLKFDFSKIASTQYNTVFDKAWEASLKTGSEAEKKYLAPEWMQKNTKTDWAKVDIFSLGVLFCDILCGEILPDFKAVRGCSKKLVQLGIPKGIIEVIGQMISNQRPDIKTVTAVLKSNKID